MTSADVIEQYRRFVIGNYTRYPICLVRGDGSYVWDAEGRRYLDFFPGWGCGLLGHCPPRVVAAVQRQVAELIHVPNTWHTGPQGALAEALSRRTDFDGRCFFCNSGTEANEAAIKLARLNNPAGRYKIIAAINSFHGRTMGALSATGQPKYHAGVEPLLPGFRHAPFGDLAAIERLIDDATCAVLIEPIQGEGGYVVPAPGFFPRLREICDRHGILLMVDEIQSGAGRTGKWWAIEHENVEPDVVCFAKGIGSGMPIGGIIARKELMTWGPGSHGSTYGGNPVAAASALATLEVIEREGLLQRADESGEFIQDALVEMEARHPSIGQVRGRGLMIGLEFVKDRHTKERAIDLRNYLVQRAFELGLLLIPCGVNAVRLTPPLNIDRALLEEGLHLFEQALSEAEARYPVNEG